MSPSPSSLDVKLGGFAYHMGTRRSDARFMTLSILRELPMLDSLGGKVESFLFGCIILCLTWSHR